MSGYPFNCGICGKFATSGSWASQYDFVAMEPSHDSEICQRCTDEFGPVLSNARPYNDVWDQFEGRILNGEYIPGSLVPERSAIADQSPSGARPRSGLDAKHASGGAEGNRPASSGIAPPSSEHPNAI